MCGRLTLVTMNPNVLVEYLGAEWQPESLERFRPRWNVGPMQAHPIARSVDGARQLAYARWGVERVIGKKPDGSLKTSHPFNAMAETALEKPAWRKALRERRCVVPATGFYEWTGPKKHRRPIHFTRRDGDLLLLAGLYDDAGPDRPLSFTVLTTPPNATLAPIHDRMPLVLDRASAEAWLHQPDPALMGPAPDDVLVGAPASPVTNSVATDGPECLGEVVLPCAAR